MATRTGSALLGALPLALAAGVLAGCGSANPLDLPAYQPSDQATGSPVDRSPGRSGSAESAPVSRRATPPPEVSYRPADALGLGAWVERGRIRARSTAERAVVDAVAGYLTVRVRLSNTWQVDETALARVAADQAVTSARERAQQQREQELRSVGRFVLNISSVRIKGDTAIVTGCDFDATEEVDDTTGATQVPPPGGVLITMRLRRIDDTWRVIDWPTEPVPYCDEWRR